MISYALTCLIPTALLFADGLTAILRFAGFNFGYALAVASLFCYSLGVLGASGVFELELAFSSTLVLISAFNGVFTTVSALQFSGNFSVINSSSLGTFSPSKMCCAWSGSYKLGLRLGVAWLNTVSTWNSVITFSLSLDLAFDWFYGYFLLLVFL